MATSAGREIAAMQTITDVLGPMGASERDRVLRWALDRFASETFDRPRRRAGLGRGPTDQQLREALAIYESAGRAPTVAVAEHFGLAHRTASLWIRQARNMQTS